jgi:hypothetical protein
MATYTEIKGRKIETISGNPSNPTDGQVWYDSASATFKYITTAAAIKTITQS